MGAGKPKCKSCWCARYIISPGGQGICQVACWGSHKTKRRETKADIHHNQLRVSNSEVHERRQGPFVGTRASTKMKIEWRDEQTKKIMDRQNGQSVSLVGFA